MSSQAPANKLEVWAPCQHRGILPTEIGPWNGHGLIRVSWVPDCAVCNDTGWAFARHVPAGCLPW